MFTQTVTSNFGRLLKLLEPGSGLAPDIGRASKRRCNKCYNPSDTRATYCSYLAGRDSQEIET